MELRNATAALLLLLSTGNAWGSAYHTLGRELAAAARGAGLRSVAFGQLEAGGRAAEAAEAQERLLSALLNEGSLQVLERSDIPELMAERALARTGAVAAPAAKPLSSAEAVLLGRYREGRDGARFSVRMVSVADGAIIAAGEAFVPAAPELQPAASPLFALDSDPDSLDCADAAEKAVRLVSSVIDLKARYWALQERRRGLDPQARPEEGLDDPALLSMFRGRRAYWLAARRITPLDRDEVSRFVEADGKAFMLRRSCGVSGTNVARRGS